MNPRPRRCNRPRCLDRADHVLGDRYDTIGSWSEHVKLGSLERYLPAYTGIMAKQRHWCRGGFHYVDAFAGTGRPKARDEDRYIKGSPRIALDLKHPFDSYTFIEETRWRAERLREVVHEYPDRRISVEVGDCNEVITQLVTPVVRRECQARGFVFLDPFGMDLRWDTIVAIAETRALEIIMNLPTMAFSRGGLPADPDALTPQHVERMNRVCGSGDWFDVFYERRDGLWQPHVVKARASSADRLGQFYRKRLEMVFAHVSDPLPVPNTSGAPIYCLLFAGHNETGAKIAADVFRRPVQVPPRRSTPAPTEALALPLPL